MASLFCPERKTYTLGPVTSTPRRCVPDRSKTSCSPTAVFLPYLHSRFIAGREPLGKDKVRVLTNVAQAWPSTHDPPVQRLSLPLPSPKRLQRRALVSALSGIAPTASPHPCSCLEYSSLTFSPYKRGTDSASLISSNSLT